MYISEQKYVGRPHIRAAPKLKLTITLKLNSTAKFSLHHQSQDA